MKHIHSLSSYIISTCIFLFSEKKLSKLRSKEHLSYPFSILYSNLPATIIPSNIMESLLSSSNNEAIIWFKDIFKILLQFYSVQFSTISYSAIPILSLFIKESLKTTSIFTKEEVIDIFFMTIKGLELHIHNEINCDHYIALASLLYMKS
ncbi:MAG: hypothetical protein MHPSP_003796, partial [Paramarteilia canceri]